MPPPRPTVPQVERLQYAVCDVCHCSPPFDACPDVGCPHRRVITVVERVIVFTVALAGLWLLALGAWAVLIGIGVVP